MWPERPLVTTQTGFLAGVLHAGVNEAEATGLIVDADPDNRCLPGVRECPETIETNREGFDQVGLIEGSRQPIERHRVEFAQESDREMEILGWNDPASQFERLEPLAEMGTHFGREPDCDEDPAY